jgi:hypothetical protein
VNKGGLADRHGIKLNMRLRGFQGVNLGNRDFEKVRPLIHLAYIPINTATLSSNFVSSTRIAVADNDKYCLAGLVRRS